jgi:ribonuclease BN (tRNA processing enzyme)
MNLHIIGSSSSGNCYVLENGISALIIEAGLPFLEVNKVLEFDTAKIAGCLVTHIHQDHFKYTNDYAKRGIMIYANDSVVDSMDVRYAYNATILEPLKNITIGDFIVKPVELTHDVPCLGFYIKHKDIGNFCFCTDTSEIPYEFGRLHNIMVECNFDRDEINTNATAYYLRDRVAESHMSIQEVINFLKMQDLSEVNNIVLLHSSFTNSNNPKFLQLIAKEIGHPVMIAKSGMKIEFNSKPF